MSNTTNSMNQILKTLMGDAGIDARDDGEAASLSARFAPEEGWQSLHEDPVYRAFARDEDFMWHWNILRDNEVIQEGCSISFDSARRSVGHVLAFYATTEVKGPDQGLAAEDLSA